MFGYVTADKPEMRVRDFYTFRSYYCGVCREIGHLYGELPRFMLTYDCGFLYLLLASLAGEKEEYGKKICPASPLARKPYAEGRVLRVCRFDERAARRRQPPG